MPAFFVLDIGPCLISERAGKPAEPQPIETQSYNSIKWLFLAGTQGFERRFKIRRTTAFRRE